MKGDVHDRAITARLAHEAGIMLRAGTRGVLPPPGPLSAAVALLIRTRRGVNRGGDVDQTSVQQPWRPVIAVTARCQSACS